MARYVALPRPPRAWVATGYTPEAQPSVTVIEADKAAVPVGIMNAEGTPFYRLPDTVPMGFHGREPNRA